MKKRLIRIRIPLFLIALIVALACIVGLVPNAQAVSPPPDGGYPGGNTAEGQKALQSLTTGGFNTAAGYFSLFANTTGSFNTAVGAGALDVNIASNNTATGAAALLLNTTGTNNTANGVDALALNDTGSGNTANGAFALFNNTTGSNNAAQGFQTLYSNTIGGSNTATGSGALYFNTSGEDNVAVGASALVSNSTGGGNVAAGTAALAFNTVGGSNTALGDFALLFNTGASNNTGVGASVLYYNITGQMNTAVGAQALYTSASGANNTALGYHALYNSLANGNIAIGANAGFNLTAGSGNIYIGHGGVAVEANTIRLGAGQQRTFIDGIRGVATGIGNAIPVLIDSAGQLGTISSSRRFKKEIKPMDKASEAILALKPVTFHYKSDKTNTPQFGLIAEEVAEANPDLVVCDENGEIYTVRYDQINAMLLNEFLKEHKKVERQDGRIREQETIITQLRSDLQATANSQQKQIEALAAVLQKVSAQLELNRRAPQTVLNSQ